jgi:hypothetical protein
MVKSIRNNRRIGLRSLVQTNYANLRIDFGMAGPTFEQLREKDNVTAQ